MFQCFANKKYMVWNFHLFSNLVSICCETFRNVSKLGLSHFWVCVSLFQFIYYIIYMFQCFAPKNVWPGIFTFSLTLFQFVAKRFDKLQISDLVIFGSVSICFSWFTSFATRHIWPGIFIFSLTLFQFVAKRFEMFQSLNLVIFGSVSICFSWFTI